MSPSLQPFLVAIASSFKRAWFLAALALLAAAFSGESDSAGESEVSEEGRGSSESDLFMPLHFSRFAATYHAGSGVG